MKLLGLRLTNTELLVLGITSSLRTLNTVAEMKWLENAELGVRTKVKPVKKEAEVTKEKVKVGIEICGHPAWINSIRGRLSPSPFHQDDEVLVHIAFDESVGGIYGFVVNIPLIKYTADQFLNAVREVAEVELRKILKQHETTQAAKRDKSERLKVLNRKADEIKATIGLG